MSEHKTQQIIEVRGRKIVLVGTAHVSKQSAQEVIDTIEQHQPRCICVELDAQRLQALIGNKRWQNLNIRQIIKRKEGTLLLVSILLSNFQRRIGKTLNVEPGQEMKVATQMAKKNGLPLVLCDRNIRTTLLRAWREGGVWSKLKLFTLLLSSLFERRSISEQEVESLKQEDALTSMMSEMARYLPVFKRVFLEERDQYLAVKIYRAVRKHTSAVAVIGAGHLPGVAHHLQELLASDEDNETIDVKKLDEIPSRSKIGRIIKIVIPIALGALIVSGFFFGNPQRGVQNIIYWVLANGIASAIGSTIALAHPFTIIASFLFAPITSLNPTIGVGFVTALVELALRKPRALDLQNIGRDSQTIKGFYKNRVTKVLLVFVLSSIGSAVGTFIALPLLLAN